MPGMSDYLENKLTDWMRGQAFPGVPANVFVALLTSIKGPRVDNTAYSLNDTFSVAGQDGKLHLYKATVAGTSAVIRPSNTAVSINVIYYLTDNTGRKHFYKVTTIGTTAASQGTLYPGASGEVITDGTAVFTEQSLYYAGVAGETMVDGTMTAIEQDAALDAATAGVLTEPSGNGYGRVSVAGSLAAWAGTQSAGSTVASTGTSGQTSNNAAVNFGAPTPAAWGFVWGVAVFDLITAGNLLYWGPLNTPKTVNGGDAAPSFAIGQFTVTLA